MTADIKAGRKSVDDLNTAFANVHPPLDRHEALVEADRCYFCYDAPCMNACPTGIDIPLFIRQISTGNPTGSAKTILTENIMGGMCARVCPTETLCEEVCVREIAEGKPVKIGELQRYATDHLMQTSEQHPFERAKSTGKKIAVVGAGPAGLSCAHRLATYGHDVTILEAREKAGGLNEFGIAAYKAMGEFASKEVDFILGIGGVEIDYGKSLGAEVNLSQLASDYDAVFLGLGLQDTNSLGLENEDADGCEDAVAYIAQLRQSNDLSKLPVGRNVVVIGGGMTAIDVAAQTKLLGAENVTICYRRGPEKMGASQYERDLAQSHGVVIRHHLQPSALEVEGGKVSGVTFDYTNEAAGEQVLLQADQVFKAIGQAPAENVFSGVDIGLSNGRVVVDGNRKSSHEKIWAGGDCIVGGEDLTVVSVQDGKLAAEDIHKTLIGEA